MLAWCSSWRALGALAALLVFLAYGLVAGLSEPAERVVIGRLAPVKTGRGFGAYQASAGLAALPAGLLFGEVYKIWSGPAALIVSAAVLLVATPLWFWAGRRI